MPATQILSTALEAPIQRETLAPVFNSLGQKCERAETAKSSTRNTIIEKTGAPTSTENASQDTCEVRESFLTFFHALKAPGVKDEMTRKPALAGSFT